MAKIKGIEGLSNEEIHRAINEGAKFVIFRYTISIVLMTFRRNSDIYFVRKGESTISKSIGFTIINFLLGWWGIPWGPIYTIGSWITNAGEGKDITQEVLASLQPAPSGNRTLSEDVLDDILME